MTFKEELRELVRQRDELPRKSIDGIKRDCKANAILGHIRCDFSYTPSSYMEQFIQNLSKELDIEITTGKDNFGSDIFTIHW